MRGRKPTPTKIKLVKGNPGHRPPPPNEPKPDPVVPKCPSFLDREAKKEWRRMVKELGGLGMITRIDRAVLAKYCEAYSQWSQASRKIQELGMVFKTEGKSKTVRRRDGSEETVKTGGGFPIINPYFRIADNAKAQMLKCCIEMGMTPSSRSRVKVEPREPENAKGEKDKNRFFN